MNDYLKVVYSAGKRPYTQYPDKLCRYLFDRFKLRPKQRLLDLGCGRGEFAKGFKKLGLEVCGVDGCDSASSLSSDMEIKIADFEKERAPYDDNSFDIVFCKSFIEHFYYPEKIVKEVYRIVKTKGKLILMTPDWESVYKIFYEDYTHRTPFTVSSLRDIYAIHGFEDITVEKFRQLPFLWKFPVLNAVSSLISFICPRSKIKLIRFSKEIMLLGFGIKD